MHPLLLVVLLLFASASHASDGVFELNNACAVNTGCFPGDVPGYPVTLANRGSYRLTGNVTPTASGLTGIEITADGVTLDLNGFSVGFCIEPPPGVFCISIGSADGIAGADATDTTLKNGAVQGFLGWGADLGRRAHVHDVAFTGNGGGGLRVLQNSLVQSNRIAFNSGTGLSMGVGTAWGSNVLTTNEPDVSGGGAVATEHNLCNGRRCGRVEPRRYYLSTAQVPAVQAFVVCNTGYTQATGLELTQPSALQYHEGLGEPHIIATGTTGWVRGLGPCTLGTLEDQGFETTNSGLCQTNFPVWCMED